MTSVAACAIVRFATFILSINKCFLLIIGALVCDLGIMKGILAKTFCVLAAAWLCACGAVYAAMRQPPESFARVMAHIPGPVAFLALPFETLWTHARAGHLEQGDLAPNFSLTKLDKSGSIQLSALTANKRPVILIFGSYT